MLERIVASAAAIAAAAAVVRGKVGRLEVERIRLSAVDVLSELAVKGGSVLVEMIWTKQIRVGRHEGVVKRLLTSQMGLLVGRRRQHVVQARINVASRGGGKCRGRWLWNEKSVDIQASQGIVATRTEGRAVDAFVLGHVGRKNGVCSRARLWSR